MSRNQFGLGLTADQAANSMACGDECYSNCAANKTICTG